ncbi:MAG: hypothetical protein LBU20_01840 [Candidatus Nomurabacteria bacterium]|jgi:SpoU rRNA methylase family enzyme|nr:hypothetical protein [Candidatus Nomurabacteria bacterium]
MTGLERLLNYYSNRGVSTVYSNLVSVEEIEDIAVKSRKMGAKSFQVSSCSATLNDDGIDDSFVVETDTTYKIEQV